MMIYSLGAYSPFILSMRDILSPYGPEFHPKRTKLKGYQRCKKRK
jgi:hypothetical protein